MFRVLRLPPNPSMAAALPVIVRRRGRLPRWSLFALLGLALANSTFAGTVHCTTYEEKTLQRWHTICDDGTRAASRYNTVLDRWETTITMSPRGRRTCTAHPNPFTNMVDVHCR
jgi:hypothetical protein